MCDVFAFLHYIIVGGFFYYFQIKLNSIFFRLRTRYLSAKSPVRFDFWGIFNIKLSIFRVFCNIKLHFFVFSYTAVRNI